MLSRIRNSVYSRFLWGFMGLYLLNISIDSPDPNPAHIREDLSINDQESILELVVEKVLGYEDAFEEYDDCDTEEHNTKKISKIEFLVYRTPSSRNTAIYSGDIKQRFAHQNSLFSTGIPEIDPPPPKI